MDFIVKLKPLILDFDQVKQLQKEQVHMVVWHEAGDLKSGEVM